MVSPSSVLGANLPSGGSVDRRNWPIPVCLRDGGRGRLCGGRGWVGRRDADHRGRRGLPRSGLHLAYVAVGRGQGRVAAHPRGRAPRRDRVVSAAPARSDIADGEDISLGGGVLPARVHRRASRSGLHRCRPGGPRRPPAGCATSGRRCCCVPICTTARRCALISTPPPRYNSRPPISPGGWPCGPPPLKRHTVKRLSSRRFPAFRSWGERLVRGLWH